MTRRQILSTLRRRGPMYLDEIGGDGAKLYDLREEGLIACYERPADRGLRLPKWLYEITPKGEAWLDNRSAFWRGVLEGMSWPVTIWRRIFK